MLPTWLPEDQRFEVEGTSNELAQVDHTLALMRDAFHPKLVEMMCRADSITNNQQLTTNHYPTMLGPTLQWIAHVSLPSATNETAYFETYQKPLAASAFDLNLMTNRAARLSYLPPTVKLQLLFGDKRDIMRARAIPGVDYPGNLNEDAGSTPARIRLFLQAPKFERRFLVEATSFPRVSDDIEYKWVLPKGHYTPSKPRRVPLSNREYWTLFFSTYALGRNGPVTICVFAREKGKPWGAPALVVATTEMSWKRRYGRNQIMATDYGEFLDTYQFDEKKNIIGFTRQKKGELRSQDFSSTGELIVESYPSGAPKIAHKVTYRTENGRIEYDILDEIRQYKNAAIDVRSRGW